MNERLLQRQQLDRKIYPFSSLQQTIVPPSGWIKAVRNALGMSLEQLGGKLGVSRQAVRQIEEREREGSVTIQTLREVAQALDMKLVYGFVPNDGSLEALVEKKARELATQIVARASQTMKLEDQENTKERLKQAIDERTRELKNEMPKMLWD